MPISPKKGPICWAHFFFQKNFGAFCFFLHLKKKNTFLGGSLGGWARSPNLCSFLEHFIQIRIQIWTRSASESCMLLLLLPSNFWRFENVWHQRSGRIKIVVQTSGLAQSPQRFVRLKQPFIDSQRRGFFFTEFWGWWHPTKIKKHNISKRNWVCSFLFFFWFTSEFRM